jgi:hypothetical protein
VFGPGYVQPKTKRGGYLIEFHDVDGTTSHPIRHPTLLTLLDANIFMGVLAELQLHRF